MQATVKSRAMKFKYEDGVTSAGKPKYSYNTINNLATDATNDKIFAILPLMGAIQSTPSTEIDVVQVTTIK